MPGSPEPFNLGYRPALDGLRGVAVLAVMVYHSGLIRGGFLGVDVFFTLSGFLITTLLLEEYARTGTLAIGRFYIRRALRLLPALVAFLIFWGGVILTRIPSEYWSVLGGYLLGVLGYVANWLYIYWRPLGVFSHTWSLAIEEQFYLVWPVLLFLLLRWVRRAPWIVAGLLAAAAGSLAWRLALALVADVSVLTRLLGHGYPCRWALDRCGGRGVAPPSWWLDGTRSLASRGGCVLRAWVARAPLGHAPDPRLCLGRDGPDRARHERRDLRHPRGEELARHPLARGYRGWSASVGSRTACTCGIGPSSRIRRARVPATPQLPLATSRLRGVSRSPPPSAPTSSSSARASRTRLA